MARLGGVSPGRPSESVPGCAARARQPRTRRVRDEVAAKSSAGAAVTHGRAPLLPFNPRGILMYDDLKMDLCRGARVLFRYGLSVGIAGHLSIKVDGGRMIANRFG